MLRETIEEWARRVPRGPSGSEAMQVLAEQPVALLLLDWELADMSADQLLDRLRSEKRSIPPVVLMTAGTRSALDVLAGILERHPLAADGTFTTVRRRPLRDAAQHRCC